MIRSTRSQLGTLPGTLFVCLTVTVSYTPADIFSLLLFPFSSEIVAPTIADAHQALQRLLPKRKLDFETLAKLPHPSLPTRICCQTAMQLVTDTTKTPSWSQTQSWLKRRPYNDVRFTRVEENPSVWISYETTISALTNLVSVNPTKLDKLAERGEATRALFLWSLAVCNIILERQNNSPKADADVEKMKEELWGRAWEWGE